MNINWFRPVYFRTMNGTINECLSSLPFGWAISMIGWHTDNMTNCVCISVNFEINKRTSVKSTNNGRKRSTKCFFNAYISKITINNQHQFDNIDWVEGFFVWLIVPPSSVRLTALERHSIFLYHRRCQFKKITRLFVVEWGTCVVQSSHQCLIGRKIAFSIM